MNRRTMATAAAVATILAGASAASAEAREWSRTFRHPGSTDVVPFVPLDLRCYTLPGVQLKRTFLTGGIAFGGGATSRDPYRLVYRAKTRRILAFAGPYYCVAKGGGDSGTYSSLHVTRLDAKTQT